ncbi:MAG: hypothetical protein PHP54_00735 [Clostridia bacterium]|nr:hypothetical protein [Clostridia bacterium]
MDIFEKLDDTVIEKIEKIKEEIKTDQKEVYAILLEITRSFSDAKKDKKYRDSLFERIDLLNIIIKENNRKINDLKNGEYRDNFNHFPKEVTNNIEEKIENKEVRQEVAEEIIEEDALEETITEIENISNELKELELLQHDEEPNGDDVVEELVEIEECELPIDDIKDNTESNHIEEKEGKFEEINNEKEFDLKKELEEIVKEVNVGINDDDIIERVPVLFSTSIYTTTRPRRANRQETGLMVKEEKEGFSERLKGVLNRIKRLIIK